MKLADAFPKPRQVIVKGEELMQWLARGNRGEINIYSMECVTEKNGSYKLNYDESHSVKRNSGEFSKPQG